MELISSPAALTNMIWRVTWGLGSFPSVASDTNRVSDLAEIGTI